MKSDYFIWTDWDLDGICSYLTLTWLLFNGKKIPYEYTYIKKFKEDFESWYNKNKDNYKKIFILDLDVHLHKELVDKPNVFIIDHHGTHENKYENATAFVQTYTSCTKYIYTLFKDKTNTKLSNEQKVLIALADDYDSYNLNYPDSYNLNIVFNKMQKDKHKSKRDAFIERFKNGFNGFNQFEQNIIQFEKNEIQNVINNLNPFYRISNNIKYVSAITEKYTNDVSLYLINTYNADIAFIINTKSNSVSFRKNNNCKIDVSKIAEKLCDGGGHEQAAGGNITDKFLEFTKTFEPIND